MSDKQYTTVSGIIQFDPQDKEISGKAVREVLIRNVGSGKQVRVTVWDSYRGVPLVKGDAIIADGSATTNVVQKDDGSSMTYNNLSCTTLIHLPQAARDDTQRVVNTSSTPVGGSIF